MSKPALLCGIRATGRPAEIYREFATQLTTRSQMRDHRRSPAAT